MVSRLTQKRSKEKPVCFFVDNTIVSREYDRTVPFYDRSCYGSIAKQNHVFSLEEGYYLSQEEKITIVDAKARPYTSERLLKRLSRLQKHFIVRFSVYSNLRKKGYIPKTALKFGSVFRVYDKGIRPGQDHAKWIVLPVNETDMLRWYEYCAQSRVAHSTKKKLLIAVVDAEKDVSYYESQWIKV